MIGCVMVYEIELIKKFERELWKMFEVWLRIYKGIYYE